MRIKKYALWQDEAAFLILAKMKNKGKFNVSDIKSIIKECRDKFEPARKDDFRDSTQGSRLLLQLSKNDLLKKTHESTMRWWDYQVV